MPSKIKLNWVKFAALMVVIALVSLGCSDGPQPANSQTGEAARALLAKLYDSKGQSVWSGQHNYPHRLNWSEDSVRSRTDRLPVVWGSDFITASYRQAVVDEAIEHHANEHVITLMYHIIRPMGHDSLGFSRGVKHKVTDAEWQQIITPGTIENDCLISKIDRPVPFLQQLRDKEVPVLWRPFHEMNGMWFWYGDRPGPDGVQLLWRTMYERYTEKYNLNNLIWVWNANGPRDWKDDEAYDYDLFYPGHDYVDVLATDIYKGDYKQSHHDDLRALAEGRPIAIGECGQLPNPSLFESQPDWVWFMTWAEWIWRENSVEAVKEVYYHPKVISLQP